MKLATYMYNGEEKVGVISSDMKSVTDISQLGLTYASMEELIRNITDEEMVLIKEKLPTAEITNLADVELMAPIPRPKRDIVCLGINYDEHAKESSGFTNIQYKGTPAQAVYFSKRVINAPGPFDFIDGHSDIVADLDYEVELAVILKKEAKDVKKEDAEDYIFGYTIINDISARTLQSQHKQWFRGKSLDDFAPMGPWIVTADEIPFPPELNLSCRVNGELRQISNTRKMMFDIGYILQEFSAGLTLDACTIIATGTPSGVAMGMESPVYLKEGDVVECEIENIGIIRNTIVCGK